MANNRDSYPRLGIGSHFRNTVHAKIKRSQEAIGALPQDKQPQARYIDVCGSPGNSQYVPEGMAATSFQGPCRKHDACYGTPGKTQEQCDQGLGQGILNECKRTGGWLCALSSYIYYKTLSVTGLGLGTPAFQDAQRQARAAIRPRR